MNHLQPFVLNNRPIGAPKINNLERRRADYSRMIAQPSFKAPDGAYHRPGSNKK